MSGLFFKFEENALNKKIISTAQVRELLKSIQKGNIQMKFCNKYGREELYIKYQFVLGIYTELQIIFKSKG